MHPIIEQVIQDLRFALPRTCLVCGLTDERTRNGGDYCADCFAEAHAALIEDVETGQ